MNRSQSLREKAIDISYEPNILAVYFLKTQTAQWKDDGVYMFDRKLSDEATEIFLDNIEKYLIDHERTKIENLNRPEIKISINFSTTDNTQADVQTVVAIVEDIVERFRGERM